MEPPDGYVTYRPRTYHSPCAMLLFSYLSDMSVGLMQLERRKVDVFKLLCIFLIYHTGLNTAPYAVCPGMFVVVNYKHTWSSVSSAGATRCLSVYRSLLPGPGQSFAVCSHRRTLFHMDHVVGLRMVGTLGYGKSPLQLKV